MSQNEKGLCLCVEVSAEVSVLCIDMILRISTEAILRKCMNNL